MLEDEHEIELEKQQDQGHILHHHQHFHVLASPITFGPHNSSFTHAYQHSKDREGSENLIFGLVWMLYSASLMHHFRPYAADDPQNEVRPVSEPRRGGKDHKQSMRIKMEIGLGCKVKNTHGTLWSWNSPGLDSYLASLSSCATTLFLS